MHGNTRPTFRAGMVGAGQICELHVAASLRTARSAGIGGRTAPPNTSTPCQPTVQMPNENLSSGVGSYAMS